jgi:DNA-binding transcriptional MerR regulator
VESDGLSPGAVSRSLGIAVTTLRTWHQRYGLGPSGHAHGSHRRYNAEDLVRLETMRRLTSEGVPAAEAARIARSGDVDSLRQARAGGGHAIPVGRAGPQARGLARAAARLDMPTVRSLIAAAVAEHGVVAAWTDLLVPVLIGIGKRHESTQRLVEVEHLLSRCVAEVLASVPRPASGSASAVLLACADEEQHSLPLEALAAALAERGLACHLLGARVPLDALLDAVRRIGPAMVVLWSQTPATADITQLTALLDLPHRPALIVAAGPGWGDNLPPAALTPASLSEALSLAVAVS